MSLLTTLRSKKPTAAATLNFQVTPEIATKLDDAAARSKVPRYDICRLLIEQGLNTLIEELDAEPEEFSTTTEEV